MSATTDIRWWWVRHAPTIGRGFIGWTDAPADLSDAAAVAGTKAVLPEPARVLTSSLARAVATEAALRKPGWGAPTAQAALREQNFGEWDGRTSDEVGETDGDRLSAFWADMATTAPPGGESFAELIARVRAAIDAQNGEPGDVVVVAHGGVVRAALAIALDLPPAKALAFGVANLSVTRTTWHGPDGGWGVDFVNRGGVA